MKYKPTNQPFRVQPVEYTYDSQGRMKTITTHSAAGDETTTWNYNP